MKFKSKNFLNKISSVDIFLIIFTLLFLVQMAYSLFTDNFLSPQSGSIDAVIRTFASAVFGYFLSGNFATPTDSSSVSAYGLPIPVQNAKNETEPKNTLGFSESTPSAQINSSLPTTTFITRPKENTLQTHIVAGIGLISLILIIVVRNLMPITDTMIAPLTQLRDMVSSSIGYLIGGKKPQ